MGRFYNCHDHSGGVDHGIRFADGEGECGIGHRLWFAWARLRSLGRTISRAFSDTGSLVSARPEMAGLGDYSLWFGGVDPAGVAAAHAARLFEHIFETRNGGGVGSGRDRAASDTVDAFDLALCRWHRSGVRGSGVSLCFHHHRLRRGFRFPFARRLGNDSQNARARVAHSPDRLRGHGDRDDGSAHGDDRGLRAGTGRIFRDQRQGSAERSGGESERVRFSGDGATNERARH